MLLSDVRYAARTLRRSPVFTATAVLTMALTIGSNTAIFSVVNAVMLRPLPFHAPDRLMRVAEKNEKLNLPYFGASVLNYLSWKEQARSLELAALGFANFTLTGRGDPEQFQGATITPSLMPVLGIEPVRGRGFREGEDRPGSARVVMISEGLWKRRFGGDASVIGSNVNLSGTAYTIVGIGPAALNFMTGAEIWTPLVLDPGREIRLNHVINVVGRLRPGASMQQAQTEMDAVAARMAAQFPEMKDWGVRLQAFYHWFVQDNLRTALMVLLSALGLVFVDCVRQRGEPAIGAGGRAAEGDRGAHGVRRRTRANARTTSHGESAACVRRRGRRTSGRTVDGATDESHAAARPAAGAGDCRGFHRAAVRAGHHAGHRPTVRLRTRVERCQGRPEYGAEAGRPRNALRAASVGAAHSGGE
jgi:hypothetical protein